MTILLIIISLVLLLWALTLKSLLIDANKLLEVAKDDYERKLKEMEEPPIYIDRVVEKPVVKHVGRLGQDDKEPAVEEPVKVPIEKEVVKYIDRIVEKPIEIPVEKEVVKYVDRDAEEKERIIEEGKKLVDEIVLKAEIQAEEILNKTRKQCEEEKETILKQAKDEAESLIQEAQEEVKSIKQETDDKLARVIQREEQLFAWRDRLAENERITAYNKTRSENHRKAALELKHEAQQIRDDMVKQGSEYVNDLRERVGRLVDLTRIEDETVFNSVSRELNERKKAHRQKMKQQAISFAEVDYHELKYDSQKIGVMAISYCDMLIDKLVGKIQHTGIEKALEYIQQAVSAVEAMFPSSVKFKVSNIYIEAKKEQLQLAYEIESYKQEQKELHRKEMEAKREEARAQRELEAERKRAEKDEREAQAAIERNRFEMAQAKTEEEINKFRDHILRLEEALRQAQERRDRAISMAQQTRCGYVYIISNIGSFGEGVYKIGMTRRVEPMERVIELGDASVPFPFDVHAMIYTEDAPGLEAHLHKAFDRHKVNVVNGRKEFFRVSLPEIQEQVSSLGIECQWVETPTAKQYRDSCYISN